MLFCEIQRRSVACNQRTFMTTETGQYKMAQYLDEQQMHRIGRLHRRLNILLAAHHL